MCLHVRTQGSGFRTLFPLDSFNQSIVSIMKFTADKKVEKVMHEFKDGKLESGKDGKGGKVTDRKQAIAIALSESGREKPNSAAKKNTS